MNNFPKIGEPVLDPNEKHRESGVDKFDLLLADGSAVDPETHPIYWDHLDSVVSLNLLYDRGSSVYPPCASEDGQVIYIRENTLVYKSIDRGVSFAQLPYSFTNGANHKGACCSADGLKYFTATGTTMTYTLDGGVTYGTIGLPIDSNALCCTSDGSIVFFPNFGNNRMYRSVDLGAFSLMSKPAGQYPGGRQVSCNADGTELYTDGYDGGSYVTLHRFGVSGNALDLIESVNLGLSIYGVSRHRSSDKIGVVLSNNDAVFSDDFFATSVTQPLYPNAAGIDCTTIDMFGKAGDTYYNETLKYLPVMDSSDPDCPYRIVADLT